MSLNTVCAAPMEAEVGVRSSGTGVAMGCGLLYGCWELNQGPLEKQPVLVATLLVSMKKCVAQF